MENIIPKLKLKIRFLEILHRKIISKKQINAMLIKTKFSN